MTPRIVGILLHKHNENCVEGIVIVTANERRNVLRLFNVSEVARQLGVGIFELHNAIRRGHVQSPQVRIARRLYFTAADVIDLSMQYEKGKQR